MIESNGMPKKFDLQLNVLRVLQSVSSKGYRAIEQRMDQTLCPGNYFDYPDDEVALQREIEFGEGIIDVYIDEIFPPNAKSLYFDPLNPPKGAVPNESIKWYSICEGGMLGLEKPVLFVQDGQSSHITQGALGNNYFINALSIAACRPQFINRLIVSTRYASKGLYMFKFFKAGKWRYVHIDDHIPCRQSGKAHFCRNANPNETFAMLVEKAYAKLHGSYEALSYGIIEQALLELTPGAGIQTIRPDFIPASRLCDEIWDSMDRVVGSNGLLACGRFIADPVTENPAIRQGIDLGCVYQIVDMCITSAEPTEDFDALTIGMVCIRNLKGSTGRFNGRWSFGHKLWLDYKEIALDLRQRTREIQHKRGIGPHPDDMPDEARLDSRYLAQQFEAKLTAGGNPNERDEDDESDTLDVDYLEKKASMKIAQPMADDLHWIQIEDFVTIFNRIYLVQDLTFEKKSAVKRFVSQWLPGDYLVGSGGPPVLVEKTEILPDEDLEPTTLIPPTLLMHPAISKEKTFKKSAFINENFVDNPMYPFTVTEPSRIVVTMQQLDRRWHAIGRLGQDPQAMVVSKFMPRQKRLETVMQYPIGIAFLIVRLNKMKFRLTEFKLRKIAYTSSRVVFGHTANAYFDLFPGRYAIIPYTHATLDRSMDYMLHIQYFPHQVEFEVEDVIAQRLQDKEESEDGVVEENEPDDNDLLEVHNETDDVSVLSYERQPVENDKEDDNNDEEDDEDEQQGGGQQSKRLVSDADFMPPPRQDAMVPLPKQLHYKRWEYLEDVEEIAMGQLYGEVGSMMHYLRSLKGEIRKLNGTIRALSVTENRQQQQVLQAAQQQQASAEQKEGAVSGSSGDVLNSGGVGLLSTAKRY